MGLDNGFIIKHKETGAECEIAYFRKYYELNCWVSQHCKRTENILEHYEISIDNLHDLRFYIEPVYNILIKLESGLVSKYDDEGYPAEVASGIEAVAYGNEFVPSNSQSTFAGAKLIHLYQSLSALIEIYENDFSHDWLIEFYSSF